MAKKQRRKQARKQVRQPMQGTAAGSMAASPAAPAQRATVTELRTTMPRPSEPPKKQQKPVVPWSEFSQRYAYVNRELKSLGILAASFLAILVVLSLILG